MNKKLTATITAILLAVAIAVLSWFLVRSGDVDITQLEESALRNYANVTVGVEQIIVEYRRDSYAKFRTNEQIRAHDDAEKQWFDEAASEDERNRWAYQLALQLQIVQADNHLPEELGPNGALHFAYYESMSDCAAERGHLGLILTDPPPTEYERLVRETGVSFDNEYYDRLEPEFGLSLDEYFDIRHDCAKQAEHYPTLEQAERDRLLALRNEHYWQEIRDFMLKNPDLIVPRLEPSQCTAEFIAECVGNVPR